MNHMEEVVKILGIKFYEKFRIDGSDRTYQINEDGMFFENEQGIWQEDVTVLYGLLIGDIDLINLPENTLTDKEREYLLNIIKPFKDKVRFITKDCYAPGGDQHIDICYLSKNCDFEHIYFPEFEKGTMYNGMNLGKPYELDELML